VTSSIEETIDQAIEAWGTGSTDAMRWTPDPDNAIAEQQLRVEQMRKGAAQLRQATALLPQALQTQRRAAALERAQQISALLRGDPPNAVELAYELSEQMAIIFTGPPPPTEPVGPRYDHRVGDCHPYQDPRLPLFLGGPAHGRRIAISLPLPGGYMVPVPQPVAAAELSSETCLPIETVLYQLRAVGDPRTQRIHYVYIASDYDGPAQW